MFNDNYSICGKYINGFFNIYIMDNIGGKNCSSDLSFDTQTTLIHEYIHFLQDISTTSGVNQSNFLHQRFQQYLHEAALGNDIIEIDIHHMRNNDIASKQRDLNDYYNGSDDHKTFPVVSSIELKEYEYGSILPPGNEYKSVYIYSNDENDPYNFGRTCILESMAYLIEKFCFNGEQRYDEMPYNSCEILCNNMYPWLTKHINILLGICELSLMHYNSGIMFYEIVSHMKKHNLRFDNINDFAIEFMPRCDFLLENYKKEVSEFCKTIDYLYNDSAHTLGNLSSYIKSLLQKALVKRIDSEDIFFISRIAEDKSSLENIIQEFDVPVINGKDVSVTGNNDDMLYMKIPYAVFRVLTTSKNDCILLNDCRFANQPLIDSSCMYAPWKQSIKKGKICPFGAFWYKFSLEGKSK